MLGPGSGTIRRYGLVGLPRSQSSTGLQMKI
uniref:Uncharacterized protein n=1 Tax=Trichinella nativa TaxID=6335 RepID=A0A0V1JA46_9BILA